MKRKITLFCLLIISIVILGLPSGGLGQDFSNTGIEEVENEETPSKIEETLDLIKRKISKFSSWIDLQLKKGLDALLEKYNRVKPNIDSKRKGLEEKLEQLRTEAGATDKREKGE